MDVGAGLSELRPVTDTMEENCRVSDRELLERAQRISVPNGPVNLQSLTSQYGWKHMRTGVRRMDMCVRELRAHTATAPFQTRQYQVVTGGEIQARASELFALLRAPTENESNALLRALYGSRFIYSSLLHTATNLERSSLLSPQSRGSTIATLTAGQQLMVRTASFVHIGVVNPFKRRSSDSSIMSGSHIHHNSRSSVKNKQICYMELLTPTQEGFRLVFCSLESAEVTAGKAPSERVIALHPFSGWLTAEPKRDNPGTLRFTFQAQFLGNLSGGCDFRVAQARLLFIGKGICRLEKVLRRRQRQHRQQYAAPGRLWQTMFKPFRVLGDHDSSGGTPHNWHCIVCTRGFLPALRKRWRRCDLCAYRVCDELSCCSDERVVIYNRYDVPLLICTRCRECINERDSENRIGRAFGGVRYAGVTLQFASEPERERRHTQLASSIIARRSTITRRTQSDPPPTIVQDPSSSDDSDSIVGHLNTDLTYY